MIENVSQFHVLSPPKCNPNLFSHFFNPYISLNLDEYDIPSGSCFSIDFFMHPSIINVVFFTFDFVICLTYVIVSCASDFVLFPIFVNVCFAFDSIFYHAFVCVSCPYDYQLITT